jgi:hypothetical protein
MSSTSPLSGPSSERLTANQFTQQTMLSDLMQQRGLLIGIAVAAGALWFFMRGSGKGAEEKAARRMVRDMRHVDDPDDVRNVLGSNLPTIVRPVLLIVLQELERQISLGFRRAEKQVARM